MVTTVAVIDEWRDRLGTVPAVENDFVCSYCLGPVTGYSQCASCLQLFLSNGMPHSLGHTVVPMTSVLNPSPWYSALVSYKGFQPSNGVVLASIAYHFLHTNAGAIERLLGGPPSILTVVPSKRRPYESQPLRIALGCVPELKNQLQQTLVYDATKPVGRKEYCPDAFVQASTNIAGARIALIEDTWVTGATAMSAAGALLEHGAVSVGVFSIARVLNDHYWAADHPYRRAMKQPYEEDNPFLWPRD